MGDLKCVKPKHLDGIYAAFYSRRDIFPHIRKDYIERNIAAQNVMAANGVVIIFSKYTRKVKLGEFYAAKGDFILHEILNTSQGNGKAGQVFADWIKFTKDANIVLTVRKDNKPARAFYKKFGFRVVSDISWSKGTLKGKVYYREGGKT